MPEDANQVDVEALVTAGPPGQRWWFDLATGGCSAPVPYASSEDQMVRLAGDLTLRQSDTAYSVSFYSR